MSENRGAALGWWKMLYSVKKSLKLHNRKLLGSSVFEQGVEPEANQSKILAAVLELNWN